MSTLADQIKLEYESVQLGSERYKNKQDNLISKGLRNETDAAFDLIRRGVDVVADKLRDIAKAGTRGPGGKYNRLIRLAATTLDDNNNYYEDYHVLAYIGLQTLFQEFNSDRHYVDINRVIHKIATRIETNHKCKLFAEAHPGYYHTVVNSFDDQLVKSYEHKHRVLMLKFNQFNITWESWDAVLRGQVGTRVIRAITEGLDIFEIDMRYDNNKTVRCILMTEQAQEWIDAFNSYRGLLSPVAKPTVIPPRDWEKVDGHFIGGYYTPGMYDRIPFIKAWSKEHKEFIEQANPTQHITAVNKLQQTSWCVNQKILEIQQQAFKSGIGLPDPNPIQSPQFPTHLDKDKTTYSEKDFDDLEHWKAEVKTIGTANKARMGKVIAYSMAMRLAQEYKDVDEFFFVYNCDFRGRIYCATSGLSPQGEDSAKALLRFSKGVPLGEGGMFWLAVQGANTWGEDKLSYEDRVDWVQSKESMIMRIVDDPLSNREWLDADKPWQFLAFCFEWEACGYGTLPDTLSYIPVGLDGSCNGLQHFSALLRDPVGAKATNLLNSNVPEDIYDEVAKKTTQKLLERDNEPLAQTWLSVGVTRKCAKRPVMTLPYGATQTSARQYIYEYAKENAALFNDGDDLWECCKYLTPILWEAISEVVVAARSAMDWLQTQTSYLVRSSKEPIKWITPIGFPVYQRYFEQDTRTITSQLLGSMTLNCLDSTKRVHLGKQRLGIAPNFVHSLDSTHMVLTICNTDFDSYAMIHDDFGTHAGKTEEMFQAIRGTFVGLYTETNPLEDWYEQQNLEEEEREDLPQFGDLNIEDVLDSEFFFG